MCFVPQIQLSNGPKGHDNLAQGLPWVTQKTRLAPKGLQACECARGQSSPYGAAPLGPNRFGKLTQSKSCAKLAWPSGPQTATLNRYISQRL
jgi:hypothetical protein